MKIPLRITAALLGLYAGLIAIQHGIFEIMPGRWLLGHFFSAAMLAAGGLLFLVFDIGLPVLAAISSFGREKRPGGR